MALQKYFSYFVSECSLNQNGCDLNMTLCPKCSDRAQQDREREKKQANGCADVLHCTHLSDHVFASHIYHFRNSARTFLCLLHRIYVELFLYIVTWFSDAPTLELHSMKHMGNILKPVEALQMESLECSFKFKFISYRQFACNFRQGIIFVVHFMVSTSLKPNLWQTYSVSNETLYMHK